MKLYSVGEADEWGHEPTCPERLQELRLAQRLLGSGRDSILLFDEMEDLLRDPAAMSMPYFGQLARRRFRADGSKVFTRKDVLKVLPRLRRASDY